MGHLLRCFYNAAKMEASSHAHLQRTHNLFVVFRALVLHCFHHVQQIFKVFQEIRCVFFGPFLDGDVQLKRLHRLREKGAETRELSGV